MTEQIEPNMMECELYVCTSCGARLAISNNESACFCGYCGQPTIIFERVSKMYKPDKILPFKISKEEAVRKMILKCRKGLFIPNSFKKVDADRVVPIYVPYMIYDIDYRDKQLICNGPYTPALSYRNAQVTIKDLPIDAAFRLDNFYSQKLEPFNLNELTDFYVTYLSGFYADCYDEKIPDLDQLAFERCKKLYTESLANKVSFKLRVSTPHPNCIVLNKRYVLLPVWFMTMKYRKHTYTILTNGQTGKVVGTVPHSIPKLVTVFLLITAIFSSLLPFLLHAYVKSLQSEDTYKWSLIGWGVIVFLLFISSLLLFMNYQKDRTCTADEKLESYAKNRQNDPNSK